MPPRLCTAQVFDTRAAGSAYARRVQTRQPVRAPARFAAFSPVVLALAACASQSGTAPHARTAGNSQAPAASGPRAAPDALRELAPDATFADLVRAARALAKHGSATRPQCLLSEAAPGYRLDAELLSALDPIPDPPAELDAALQANQGRLAALSAWGVLGAPDATVVLASFTGIAPQDLRANPSALLLTENGAYLRSAARASTEADGPLPPEGALNRLKEDATLGVGPLFVSAEAGVPLAAVAALLQALAPERSVALAVALPFGTRLPAASAELGALACPDGLPEVSDERPEGGLDAAALSAALRAVVPDAERCLANARGPGRAGGALTLALRIGATGTVEHACAVGGDLNDAGLVACVIEVARNARYPVPSPAGFVDVHAPLRLSPAPWPSDRPFCFARPVEPH